MSKGSGGGGGKGGGGGGGGGKGSGGGGGSKGGGGQRPGWWRQQGWQRWRRTGRQGRWLPEHHREPVGWWTLERPALSEASHHPGHGVERRRPRCEVRVGDVPEVGGRRVT
jgi:hypothetical protein